MDENEVYYQKRASALAAISEGKRIRLLVITVCMPNRVKVDIDVYEDKDNYYVYNLVYPKDSIDFEDLGVQLVIDVYGKPTTNFSVKLKYDIL